jgi:hypothetical protein
MKTAFIFLKENWMGVSLLVGMIAWISIALISGGCPMCAAAEWLDK